MEANAVVISSHHLGYQMNVAKVLCLGDQLLQQLGTDPLALSARVNVNRRFCAAAIASTGRVGLELCPTQDLTQSGRHQETTSIAQLLAFLSDGLGSKAPLIHRDPALINRPLINRGDGGIVPGLGETNLQRCISPCEVRDPSEQVIQGRGATQLL